MTDFKNESKNIFSTAENRSKKHFDILSAHEDLISLVLRSHLVIEELLYASVQAFCQSNEHLKLAKLRFPQLIAMLRALEKISVVSNEHWESLVELNKLRNALAHNLEPTDLKDRVSRLIKKISSIGYKPQKGSNQYESLKGALCYLIGALEAVSVWHAAVEALITERAVTDDKS